MEVLDKHVGSILLSIMELLMERFYEEVKEHWLGSCPKLWSAIHKIQIKLPQIKNRIVDAEKRAYVDRNFAIHSWMEGVRDIICDTGKVLDEIDYRKHEEKFEQKNKCLSYLSNYFFEKSMIEKLDEIDKKIEVSLRSANSHNLAEVVNVLRHSAYRNTPRIETTSRFYGEIFGRDAIRDHIIKLLTKTNPAINEEHILSIIGMGGIGKTTLAKMVYNHPDVEEYFDLMIWVCVSLDFDEKKIIRQILEAISYDSNKKGESERNYECLDVLTKKMVDELKGKRYFLVLDDVWNENPDKWQIIANGLKIDDGNKGSKVLVTTRNKSVANIVSSSKSIQLEGLSEDVLWDLMKTFVFHSTKEKIEEHEAILKKIMSNLKGSPLAAKTVGHMLRSNPNKTHWEHISSSKIWTLKQNEDDITPALMLSYQNLPEYLKPCFAFCSLYPQDYVYEKKEIVRMWISLGYIAEESETKLMEDIGEEYVNELLDRSMFQTCTEDVIPRWKADASEWFKIHDLIHDVAKMVSANDSQLIHDERTMKRISSSTRNLSIYIDNLDWSWKGHDSFDDFKNVRTLILLSKYRWLKLGGGIKDFLQKALPNMKFLRVLDLSLLYIENFRLPKLKHLRYLKLNVATVDKVGGSLACLYKLQVLECWGSRYGIRMTLDPLAPARQIRYLENLRHLRGFRFDTTADPFLENYHFLQELDLSVSKQASSFRCMQWMRELCATKEKENGHHKLKALGAMKWMRELSIGGLENVESKEEALEAELKSMHRLTKLTLCWDVRTPSGDNVEDILEALDPGPNISVLEINGYDGMECPGWMESLSLLRELKVKDCNKMKFIHTRGLKMIKGLHIWGCEELGVEDGFEGFSALNTLEELVIVGCPQLIADLFTEGRGGLPSSLKNLNIYILSSGPPINVSSTIMQSLTNLTNLDITTGSVDSGYCFMAPSPINPPEVQQLQQLRWLDLGGLSAEEVKGWLLYLQGCTTLVHISQSSCSGLLFDTETEDALVSFVSLRYLNISNCNGCHSLPSRLSEFPSLKQLYIRNCPLLIEYVEKVRQDLDDRGWDIENVDVNNIENAWRDEANNIVTDTDRVIKIKRKP